MNMVLKLPLNIGTFSVLDKWAISICMTLIVRLHKEEKRFEKIADQLKISGNTEIRK